MLYFGQFSFLQDMPQEASKEVELWHGHLTSVAEAA